MQTRDRILDFPQQKEQDSLHLTFSLGYNHNLSVYVYSIDS